MNSDLAASWILIPCCSCDGTGYIEVIAGNSPYDILIACEDCGGSGEAYSKALQVAA